MYQQDNLLLDANFTADASHLLIHYKVRNNGALTVYLLNRVFRQDKSGEKKIHKDFAYVYVEPHRVVIEKAIPAIPPGVSPYEPVAPLVTALRPGASFAETVALALPLVDSRPYARPMPSDKTEPVQRVHFVLGYMIGLEGTTERTETHFGEPVLLFTNPPGKFAPGGRFDAEDTIAAVATGQKVSILVVPGKP
jgi:hypothetical protein